MKPYTFVVTFVVAAFIGMFFADYANHSNAAAQAPQAQAQRKPAPGRYLCYPATLDPKVQELLRSQALQSDNVVWGE